MEIRLGAAQPNLIRRRGHEIDWYEMPRASPMSPLDNEVSDRAGDRINHNACQLPADTVITNDFAPNPELRALAHAGCLSFVLLFALRSAHSHRHCSFDLFPARQARRSLPQSEHRSWRDRVGDVLVVIRASEESRLLPISQAVRNAGR
jgi:hypothetical protein